MLGELIRGFCNLIANSGCHTGEGKGISPLAQIPAFMCMQVPDAKATPNLTMQNSPKIIIFQALTE